MVWVYPCYVQGWNGYQAWDQGQGSIVALKDLYPHKNLPKPEPLRYLRGWLARKDPKRSQRCRQAPVLSLLALDLGTCGLSQKLASDVLKRVTALLQLGLKG